MSSQNFDSTTVVFALFLIVCLSFWTNSAVSKLQVIPQKFLFIVFTVLVVVILKLIWTDFRVTTEKVLSLPPLSLHVIYFPLFVLKTYVTADKYVFFTILPFTICVTTATTLLNVAMFASSVKFMWDWPWIDSVLFAIILAPSQNQFIADFFVDISYKKLKEELDGESVIGVAFILCYFELTLGFYTGVSSLDIETCVFIFGFKMFCGLFAGYVIGLVMIYFVRMSTGDAEVSAGIIFLFHLVSYLALERAHVSAYFALLTMGLVILQHRDQIMEDNLVKITNFIQTFHYITNFAVFAYSFFLISIWGMSVYYKTSLLVYLTMIISRMFSLLIFYPLLRCLSPTFNFTRFMMFAWSKIIGNSTFIMVITMSNTRVRPETTQVIMGFVFVMTVITHSLNSISYVYIVKMKLMKMKTLNQLTNMVDALKDMCHQKATYIAMWKIKNIMADVRWDIVNESTELKMPYKRDDAEGKEAQLQLAPKKATCPDCNIVVVAELSTKDKTDMKIEATRRMLKEMKMHLVRLQTLGLLTTECSVVVTKMITDSNDVVIDMTQVNTYLKNNKCLEFTKQIYTQMVKFSDRSIKEPRKPFRRRCYQIIMSKAYKIAMIFINIASIYPVIVFAVTHTYPWLNYSAVVTNYLFTLIFLLDMVATIFAYSFIYYKEGFNNYFRSYTHIFDCLTVLMSIADVVVSTMFIVSEDRSEWDKNVYYCRLVRLIILLKVFQGQFMQLLRLFDEFVDIRIAFGFEIIKTFRNCYDEVLLTLSKKIGNNYELEMECRQSVENGRWGVLELVLKIQLERPWVAVSVKTKHVMSAVIKSMYGTLFDLKRSGFLDEFEYERLKINLKIVEMRRSSLSKKLMSGTNELITGIAWMSISPDILNYIIDSAIVVNFPADTIVCQEDDNLGGIYVVLTGVLKIEYTPRFATMETLLEKGNLPVIDFIETNTFDRHRYELILPGNTFGELCYLTNRTYDAKITAICDVKAILFTNEVITEAISRDSDTISGFGSKMWKVTVHDMCLWILSSQHVFENLSTTEMRQKLERSFIPNLRGFRRIDVNSEIEDLILIDGQITNVLTSETFKAPCYIPRNVTSFDLLLNEETDLNAVILIIPAPEADITTLVTQLIESGHMAAEADVDFRRRKSKISPYKPAVPKETHRKKAQSSLFNPMEMLKLYRKKSKIILSV